MLQINPDGTLQTPAPTFATSPGTSPSDLTIHPSGRFLYALDKGGPPYYITQYSIDTSSGALTSLGVVSTGSTATRIRIDPSGRFVYECNSTSFDIWTYSVNQQSGLLTQIGSPVNTGLTMNSIDVVGFSSY